MPERRNENDRRHGQAASSMSPHSTETGRLGYARRAMSPCEQSPDSHDDLKSGKVERSRLPADDARQQQPTFPCRPSSEKTQLQGTHAEKLAATSVKPADGIVKLHVSLKIPEGWKINQLASMSYWLDSPQETGAADRTAFGRTKLAKPVAEFDVPVKISGTGEDELHVSLNYNYCQEGDAGVCKFGAVIFTVPLTIAADGKAEPVSLVHEIVE
jgi:hypothetical protein